ATVGRHVAAQAGDLDLAAAERGGHRAVRQPGRPGADPGGGERGGDRLGPRRRRRVDVAAFPAEQSVAHRPANKAQFEPGRGKGGDQRPYLRLGEPGRGHGRFSGSMWPRPISPPRRCGGTQTPVSGVPKCTVTTNSTTASSTTPAPSSQTNGITRHARGRRAACSHNRYNTVGRARGRTMVRNTLKRRAPPRG